MKSSWVLTAVLAIVLALPLTAGEYHFGETLLCPDCHTMHNSQSHGFASTNPPSTTPTADGDWLAAGGPNRYLLKAPTRNALCLTCHDGQTFAPDVYGANTNSYIRHAGAITSGGAPYEEWKGHTLDGRVTPPGGYANLVLECVSCHFPHGNTAFRNVDAITYAKETNNTTMDVFLRSFTVGDLETNYSVDTVDLNEPNNRASKMGQFCRGCHTDFHGRAGDSNMGGSGGVEWERHPTADANIGALGGGHSSLAVFQNKPYRVKVMSPSGDWGTQGLPWPSAPATLTPTCITCHKAHGNQNPFGLIFLAGSGPITEEGDAEGNSGPSALRIRTLCAQCHVQ